MADDAFEGQVPHPALPALGRAIFLDPAFPSGSPANYEELRGCPSPDGWTKLRQRQPERTGAQMAEQAEAVRARFQDAPLVAEALPLPPGTSL